MKEDNLEKIEKINKRIEEKLDKVREKAFLLGHLLGRKGYSDKEALQIFKAPLFRDFEKKKEE